MSAVEELAALFKSGTGIDHYQAIYLTAKSILELAEEEAGTDGFAHTVAGWAENAQDRCEKLEEKVRALENHLEKMDSVQTDILMTIHPPAPELDALVAKYLDLIRKDGGFIYGTDHIAKHLCAFAAELGVK